MKKFIIKSTYTATEQNSNFKGQTHIHYSGKAYADCGGWDGYNQQEIRKYSVRENGYDTMRAARIGLAAKNRLNAFEMSYGDWKVHSEIIEIEV